MSNIKSINKKYKNYYRNQVKNAISKKDMAKMESRNMAVTLENSNKIFNKFFSREQKIKYTMEPENPK